MTDFELRDTPALTVLRQMPTASGRFRSRDIAAAQDLLRISKKLLGTFSEAFERRGLSPGRYSVLMVLRAAESSLAPSDLAQRIGVSRPTVTGLILGLVRDGLVAYLPSAAGDRRRKAIVLTKSGRALLSRVVPDIFALMAALLTPLSGKERAALMHLLSKVEAGLRREPSADDGRNT